MSNLKESFKQLILDNSHVSRDKAEDLAIVLETFAKVHYEELQNAVEEFVHRCDKGEVRSIRSYARFKAALEGINKEN